MIVPATSDDWVALTDEPLPLDRLASWPVVPGCGAVVVFTGTVRDHAEGRAGVVSLEYEAYSDGAMAEMALIAGELRQRWPTLGRVALLHRTGRMVPCDASVAVAVSAPHRPEAFDAARYGIDAIKSRVPIWKRETWDEGQAWGTDAHPLQGAGAAAPRGHEHASPAGAR